MVNFDGLVACLLDDQAEANFTVDDWWLCSFSLN
jgi:hypothetical protein